MRQNDSRGFWRLALIMVTVILSLGPRTLAQTQFSVLHSFTAAGGDGGGLWGSVAFDKHGNLYGTTSGGGTYGYGTVFQLSPNSSGTWSENILRSFMNPDSDGSEPSGGLALDAEGNVYGTTTLGGLNGGGTIFELTSGSWDFSVLYQFCSQANCTDGGNPFSGPVLDDAGNLFSTAGFAVELSPDPSGWVETVLYRFCSSMNNVGGCEALGGLVIDKAGNLYGATEVGGAFQKGTTYELRHSASGWRESLPHSFGSFPRDGSGPLIGHLGIDGAGNLYGTTGSGGSNLCFGGCGTIYELVREGNGSWKEKILYNFANGTTGFSPGAGVAMDKAGNLYGATVYGGSPTCGCGTIYKLAPGAGGTWTYTVLHTFSGLDGSQPDANLVVHDGKLYGTTVSGGAGGFGVVFEITP